MQRPYRRKIYLETIEGVDPVYSACFRYLRGAGGICSARIDFQLGTNAVDTTGMNFKMEARKLKKMNEASARDVSAPRKRQESTPI